MRNWNMHLVSLLPQLKTVNENIDMLMQEAGQRQTMSLSQSGTAAIEKGSSHAQGSASAVESEEEEEGLTHAERADIEHVLENQTQQIISKMKETRELMTNASRTLASAITKTSQQEMEVTGRAAESLNHVFAKHTNRVNDEIRNHVVESMQTIEDEVVSINGGLLNVSDKLNNASGLKSGTTRSSNVM